MKIDDSNKKYSIIIVGILLITTVAVFVAFTLGVLDKNIFSGKGAQPIAGGVLNNPEGMNSENHLKNKVGIDNLVPGSKSGCNIDPMDTEVGEIKVDVQQDPNYVLPLCFDADDLAGFNEALNITLTVCGGYIPKDVFSHLDLKQTVCGTIYEEGEIDIVWHKKMKPAALCCCWEIYTAEFTLPACEKFCFVSSQPPTESDIPSCMDIKCLQWGSEVKEVEFELDILWTGCHFWTIPASDLQFPESPAPNEFLKISSPVECDNYLICF